MTEQEKEILEEEMTEDVQEETAEETAEVLDPEKLAADLAELTGTESSRFTTPHFMPFTPACSKCL